MLHYWHDESVDLEGLFLQRSIQDESVSNEWWKKHNQVIRDPEVPLHIVVYGVIPVNIIGGPDIFALFTFIDMVEYSDILVRDRSSKPMSYGL